MANEIMNTVGGNLTPQQKIGGGGQLSVFANAESFNLATRMASALAQSTVVPRAYQGNVGNCMIAIEMASRINTSPMMVMQNLYIVNGNPAWSSQWIIAMINSSKRYKTELQFEFGYDSDDEGLSCKAWAEDYSGHRVEGPKITMKMAREEGWSTKSGSKQWAITLLAQRITAWFCPPLPEWTAHSIAPLRSWLPMLDIRWYAPATVRMPS